MESRGTAHVVEVRPGMPPAALRQVFSDIEAAAAQRRDIVCRVYGVDLTVVDALARVELLRRRLGVRCRVCTDRPGVLAELLSLVGVREALGGGLEMLGEAEAPEE